MRRARLQIVHGAVAIGQPTAVRSAINVPAQQCGQSGAINAIRDAIEEGAARNTFRVWDYNACIAREPSNKSPELVNIDEGSRVQQGVAEPWPAAVCRQR